MYLSLAQVEHNSIVGYVPHDLTIHSMVPPEQWLPAVRRIIAAADPEQPVSRVRSMSEIVADNTALRVGDSLHDRAHHRRRRHSRPLELRRLPAHEGARSPPSPRRAGRPRRGDDPARGFTLAAAGGLSAS